MGLSVTFRILSCFTGLPGKARPQPPVVLQRRVAASKARDTMTMMRCCRARLAQRDLGARRDAREQRVATIHSIGLSVLVDQP